MRKIASRLIVFCAVIMGFMLVGYDISFDHTQSFNLETTQFALASEMPVNGAQAPREQTPPAWRPVFFEWMFLPAIVLGLPLFIVRALVFSAASMLPALPQASAATAHKQAVPYASSSMTKIAEMMRKNRKSQRFRRILLGDHRHWRFRCLEDGELHRSIWASLGRPSPLYSSPNRAR